MMRNLAKCACAIALGVAMAGCANDSGSGGGGDGSKPELKIGMAVARTGYLATADGPLAQGAELAAKAINDAGGIDGAKVKLVKADTQSVATNLIQQTNRFLTRDRVSAIISGYQSAAVAGQVPVAAKAEVPVLAAGTLSKGDAWAFTTWPPNATPAQLTIAYAKREGFKSLGIIAGQTPYGAQYAAELRRQARAAGISTKLETVQTTATSTAAQLQSIGKVDAITDTYTGPLHLVQAKDMTQLGLTSTWIQPADSKKTCQESGAAYRRMVCIAFTPDQYPDIADPQVKKRAGAVQKLWGGKPFFATGAHGWDAVNFIADAYRKASGSGGAAIRDALVASAHVGATGVYRFSKDTPYGVQGNPYAIMNPGPWKVLLPGSDLR